MKYLSPADSRNTIKIFDFAETLPGIILRNVLQAVRSMTQYVTQTVQENTTTFMKNAHADQNVHAAAPAQSIIVGKQILF